MIQIYLYSNIVPRIFSDKLHYTLWKCTMCMNGKDRPACMLMSLDLSISKLKSVHIYLLIY